MSFGGAADRVDILHQSLMTFQVTQTLPADTYVLNRNIYAQMFFLKSLWPQALAPSGPIPRLRIVLCWFL